jgi:hypothetical protein
MFNPVRNNSPLVLMQTSPDSPIMSTAGLIPAWLKCLVVLTVAESNGKGLSALVQTFPTGLIYLIAELVIVEK